MKRSKILLLSIAMTMSTAFYAGPTSKIYDLEALSLEIGLLLRNANRTIEKGATLIVFFSISEKNEIQHVTVSSPDQGISDLLQKKLQNRKLDGKKWREGKIYELAVGYAEAPVVCAHS